MGFAWLGDLKGCVNVEYFRFVGNTIRFRVLSSHSYTLGSVCASWYLLVEWLVIARVWSWALRPHISW